MNDDLVLTAADLTITKNSENCVLFAYPDPASQLAKRLVAVGLWQKVLAGLSIPLTLATLDGHPWTIGWGHTGSDVHQGLVWTQQQADAALLADMQSAEANVRAEVQIALSRPEFVALCDFTFNIGNAAFDTSTLLQKLNAGDTAGAIAEFARWNLAGGQVLGGLVKRRAAEAALFRLGLSQSTAGTSNVGTATQAG